MEKEEEKTVNIVKLVDDNPLMKLSGDYKSEIISKINEKFTTYEQQIFVANFYVYLNYNTKKDFIVNLDDIWKWLGFSQKIRAKELVINNFEENKDYIENL